MQEFMVLISKVALLNPFVELFLWLFTFEVPWKFFGRKISVLLPNLKFIPLKVYHFDFFFLILTQVNRFFMYAKIPQNEDLKLNL